MSGKMQNDTCLANSCADILTKIVPTCDIVINLPLKFQDRLSQRQLEGADGVAMIIDGQPSSFRYKSKIQDLQTCLLMDFPKEQPESEDPNDPKQVRFLQD